MILRTSSGAGLSGIASSVDTVLNGLWKKQWIFLE